MSHHYAFLRFIFLRPTIFRLNPVRRVHSRYFSCSLVLTFDFVICSPYLFVREVCGSLDSYTLYLEFLYLASYPRFLSQYSPSIDFVLFY